MVTRLCLWLTLRLQRSTRPLVALGLCLAVSLTVIAPAASQGPLGQPIGGGLPPAAPKRVKPARRPVPAPVRAEQSQSSDQAGLGDPIGGMSEPLRVANPFVKGRYPTFGMADDSYGIEMSLWPEDMELANGLLQWRVNIVRFSPAVSTNYRTPLRPDGYVTGVGAITASMSLNQNGNCISVLSIGGRAMAKIEVACSRGPGLMFRVLKPPRQTRWLALSAVFRETDGLPTVVQEYLADMWTGKVWQVTDFRSEGFTVDSCSSEARTLWNSASAHRLGLRVDDCLNTALWPSDENRFGGQPTIADQTPENTTKAAPSPDETAAWINGYRDNFLGREVRVTTTATARVRSFPTSDGSAVRQTLQPDTGVYGRWVTGRDPTTRWLKLASSGGYVWDGNLTETRLVQEASKGRPAPPILRTNRTPGPLFPLEMASRNIRINANFGAFGPGPVSDPDTYISGQYHPGVDIRAQAGATVLAPVSGDIVYYHRLRNSPREPRWINTFIVLRGNDGSDYILGHVECTICKVGSPVGDYDAYPIGLRVPVTRGCKIGVVADLDAEKKLYGYPNAVGTHLHFSAVGRAIVDDRGRLLSGYLAGNWGRLEYPASEDANPVAARALATELHFVDVSRIWEVPTQAIAATTCPAL